MDVFILHEKWGVRAVPCEYGIADTAYQILAERLKDGFYYNNWDDGDSEHQWEDRAKAIYDSLDGHAAYHFLQERDEFEYEGIELQ